MIELLKKTPPLVVGLGVSGQAVARFLSNNQIHFFSCDTRKDLPNTKLPFEIERFLGVDVVPSMEEFSLAIVSPGLPVDCGVVSTISAPKISELEFSLAFAQGKKIGVTGTLGKSSCVSLLAHLLNESGFKSKAGGNLGESFLDSVGEVFDYLVVECSSYQLELGMKKIFDGAIFLNFSSNHLERHKTIEKYLDSKLNLFRALKPDGFAVIPAEDPWGIKRVLKDQKIYEVLDDFAKKTAEILGCKDINKKAETFKGLPFRFEIISKDPLIINDSKSTTVLSTKYAIEKAIIFKKDIILLIGGREKLGSDWSVLPKVKEVIRFGELEGSVGKLRDAVVKAKEIYTEESMILFSPGAASFDEFSSFEDRGRVFNQLIESIFRDNALLDTKTLAKSR